MITMMKIMMMRTTMTNNNVPKNKRRNGIATNVSASVCMCVDCCVWSSSSSRTDNVDIGIDFVIVISPPLRRPSHPAGQLLNR